MRLALGTIAAIAAGAAATASAQFTYELQIVVTANELPAAGVGGQLASLTPGTVGLLTIEIKPAPTNYPGWTTDTIKAHDILSLSLDIGPVSAQGNSAFYPSANPLLALLMAYNDLSDIAQQIRTDAMTGLLSWNIPDIGFSSLVIRQDSKPGLIPQLFPSTSLPTSPDPFLANTRLFILESASPGNPRVTFLIFGVQGTLSDDCRGDANNDGLVTPADFGAWITAFNTQSPLCDQNEDGSCTPADFGAWVSNFNAGC